MKKQNGITLIALVITIIVLLILAGISISMLSGENGILTKAASAKLQTEISNEKEIVSLSAIESILENEERIIEKNNLQLALDNNAGAGKTEVIENGDNLVVKFIEKNRYYEVDADGNAEGPKNLIKDESAGDLSKGGTADGSEEKPYQISCIEDLVVFSIMTNGGNAELGISSNQFNNKYVELTRTLDFKSIFSYDDYTTTRYGDLNTDGIIEDIRTELTKTDEGCIGFTGIKNFRGTFDGKENFIKNIYQNTTLRTALFINESTIRPNEITNLSLSGEIISEGEWAAGISSKGANNISNCKNYANVTGYNMVGGISDLIDAKLNIENCENYGTIKITGAAYAYSGAGGILGTFRGDSESSNSIIKNCVNYGNIAGNSNCAGILGCLSGGEECEIINCINKGESESGILELLFYGKASIFNCSNLGKMTNSGIVENIRYNEIIINNCYNAGISNKAIIGRKDQTGTIDVINTYYDISKSTNIGLTVEGIIGLTESEMKNNETFVETLNSNIGENTEWKHWKIGEDGYPTLE